MLTVLDEHTKEVHVLRSERRISSADIISPVKSAIAEHGALDLIRAANGPEFIAKELQQWLANQKINPLVALPLLTTDRHGFSWKLLNWRKPQCASKPLIFFRNGIGLASIFIVVPRGAGVPCPMDMPCSLAK